jgi:Spy/CpxP family protein refolding chaperone
MLERARQHAQIFALLTPEQQQTFKQMKPHRGDREGRHSRS